MKKQFFITDSDGKTPDKIVATVISWNDGCNPTVEKKKKKKKGKKVNVEVKVDSFFNIFKSLDGQAEPKEGETAGKEKKDGEDDDEDGDDEMETQLQDAVEIGDQIKDDLVPLALEYYLGVIELEEADMDEDDSGDDDDDGEDKKKKKGGKKGGKDKEAAAANKECKN